MVEASEFIAICGWNKQFQPQTVGGCGQPIYAIKDLYRCADCDIGFHKDCLRLHFTKVVTQEDIDREGDADGKHP